MELLECTYCFGGDVAVVISTLEGEEFPLCVACHSAFDLALEVVAQGYVERDVMPCCAGCGERTDARLVVDVPPYGNLCPECLANHEAGWLL